MSEYVFISQNEAQTADFGKRLAKFARFGDVFALNGTLGMGKSVLARAFVQELSGAEEVPSPTFTLVQSYEAPEFEIFHYDLYRLKSPEEIFEIGMEDMLYQGVSLIEWPEMMGAYLPKDIFEIDILPLSEGRKIVVSASSAEKMARLQKLEENNG